MKILLIEDEVGLQTTIKEFLQQEGAKVEIAIDFNEAEEKINLYEYDCVLVDITIPHGTGLSLIQQLKNKRSKTGIIIVSAKNSVDDKVNGLDLGADDYLPKPFHLSELNARIKSLVRRKSFDGNTAIELNEIKILPVERRCFIHAGEIILTSREYELLLFFIANKNRVITKNSIAEHLWGDNADQANNHDFIYTHIKNLRKKLLEKGCNDYIATVYGIGYNFKTSQ
jgi:DNA-binding response OmpR family regulator